MLLSLCAAPVHGAAPGSVSGVVRDSAGVPQIGAVVELLRPDMSVIATVYTNRKGGFSFAGLLPGKYAVKAIGSSFLPSLRENVRVRTSTIVNLTLNTLYEVMQWLPAEPRGADSQRDDWEWTLRSAANRPLLRWLEDGPLVVVSDGPRSKPKLKARLVATGRQGSFGEDGQRISVEIQNTPSDSRELLASVDFEPGTDGQMESMLGFRQDLGFAGSVQSVAAVAVHPEIESGTADGLSEAVMRSWESMNLGDEFEAEVGTQQVLARFAHGTSNTIFATQPFFSAGWRNGGTTVRYRLATATSLASSGSELRAASWLPPLSVRDGNLVMQRGLHQELAWERRTDASGVSLLVYADALNDPVLQASSNAAGVPVDSAGSALYDSTNGMLRVAANGYSSAGVIASFERRVRNGGSVRLTYANGDALVIGAAQRAATLTAIARSARPKRAQMYSLSLSGTIEGTGTRWRASYRWQPEDTVTSIAPYAANAAEPYLNIHLRQPIYRMRDGGRSLDAMLDLRNALAEGSRSYVLTNGSLLVFAQNPRSVGAGLAFTF